MNEFQAAYTLALALLAVPAWGRQRYAWACLVGNLIITLAICLAMDLGMDGSNARLSMMLVDLVTGAVLAIRPGLPRVIAAGYAVTIPLYLSVISGLFTRADADFTVIYIVAALQIGALGIGSLGGISGGSCRRLPSGFIPVAPQEGDSRLLPRSVSRNVGENG